MNEYEPLEKMWGELLSREQDLVILAFQKLDQENRSNVVKHLKTMVNENGWHREQKKSARFALRVIHSKYPDLPKS